MANLPREMVDEIFLRLPVKSLLRFRSLNQSWYTRIRSPNFVRSYKQHHANTMDSKKVILYPLEPDSPMYSVTASTCTEGEATMDVVSHNFGHDYAIVGSCDGLLLVLVKDSCELRIWNPSTREFKRLPKYSRINSYTRDWDLFGFGCVSSSEKESYNNYKVLHIEIPYKHSGIGVTQIVAQVFLYTTRTNTWRRIADSPYLEYSSSSVLVNSKLHFLARKLNEILTFDITEEEFGVIPKPDCAGRHCFSITELNGKLCIGCCEGIRFRYLWVMKEYGVKESWVNMFCIDLDKVTFCELLWVDVWPLHILEDGNILLHGAHYDVNTSVWTTMLIVFDNSATCCKFDCATSKSRYKSIFYEETPLSPNAI